MGYLLTSIDEQVLVDYLMNQGFALLGDDKTCIDVFSPQSLQTIPQNSDELVQTLIFWDKESGAIVTNAESKSQKKSAEDRVQMQISLEALGEAWPDAIDLTETPVIRFRRCFWRDNNEKTITPALLQGMSLKKNRYPEQALKRFNKAEKWLKKQGKKKNPFDFYPEAKNIPKNLSQFWVYVLPDAEKKLAEGIHIYPWSS